MAGRHDAVGSSTGASVPAVVKTVSIVRHLNARAPAGATLADIATTLGITRSHCHNILRTLVGCGWLAYDPAQRLYRLKPGIAADTAAALNAAEPLSDLRPVLVKLAREVRLPCILSRPEPDGSFIVVDKAEGGSELGISVPIAHRFPTDAPVQRKAALAWCDEAKVEAWLAGWTPVAYTDRSIVDRARMAEELALTRRRGYAVSVGEFVEGVMSVGLPIFDRFGEVSLLLQCPGLTEVVEPRVDAIGSAMLRAVAECHTLIGAKPPNDFPSD